MADAYSADSSDISLANKVDETPRAFGGIRKPLYDILQAQPDKLDYASPTQFRFLIKQLPKVQFFNVSANLPGVSMSPSIQPATVLGRDIPIHGDKVAFEELTIGFMVDEYLENYRELHAWLMGIGFPSDKSQYVNWSEDESLRIGGHPAIKSRAGLFYADASLIILSNKNNPIVEVSFADVFPISLSGLDYSQNATDVEYLEASATFAYQVYDIKRL